MAAVWGDGQQISCPRYLCGAGLVQASQAKAFRRVARICAPRPAPCGVRTPHRGATDAWTGADTRSTRIRTGKPAERWRGNATGLVPGRSWGTTAGPPNAHAGQPADAWRSDSKEALTCQEGTTSSF